MKTPPDTTPAPRVQLRCKVLAHGMIFADAHHAAGKELLIPEPEAKALAGLTPPQVEIIGVG